MRASNINKGLVTPQVGEDSTPASHSDMPSAAAARMAPLTRLDEPITAVGYYLAPWSCVYMISWFTIGTYSVYMFHLTESRPTRDEITLYPNLGRGLVDTIKCLHLAGGVIINDIDAKRHGIEETARSTWLALGEMAEDKTPNVNSSAQQNWDLEALETISRISRNISRRRSTDS
ncbi:hypothetical protein H103_05186 [Trichophyton rubrum CBS 288.86]|nr:hypothetical protein H103_05186 [Trichophyton rubrum CBS 288.86]